MRERRRGEVVRGAVGARRGDPALKPASRYAQMLRIHVRCTRAEDKRPTMDGERRSTDGEWRTANGEWQRAEVCVGLEARGTAG